MLYQLLFIFISCHGILIQAYYTDEYDPKDDPSTADFPPSLSLKFDLRNGERALVFDNVVSFSWSWAKDGNTNIGLTPWTRNVDKITFQKFGFWQKFLPLLESSLDKKIRVEHIQFELAHALDPRPPVTSEFCAPNRYVAILFGNEFWVNNDYGQLSFYTELTNKNISKTKLEIVESVHPRRGRLVVFPSCQINVLHPPSPSYKYNMHMLKMWFTTDLSAANSELVKDTTLPKDKQDEEFSNFNFDSDPGSQQSYQKCLKRTFYDSTGEKGVFVFDDLFSYEDLRAWKQHLFKYSNPGSNPYDAHQLEDHDNVATITGYNITSFMKTAMWKRVLDQISFVSGEDKWYPYDVAMNYVRSSDNTRIHPDAETHQFEYTYLLYLTEGLESKHLGETIWVEMKDDKDGITKFTGDGGEEYEPFAAVKPKFGRVVIFRNTIEHSARPLSTDYLGDRYSFAVKVGRTKRNAMTKLCYEAIQGLSKEDMTKKLQAVDRQMQIGLHDEGQNSKLTVETMETMYSKVKEKLKKQQDSYVQEVINLLCS